MICRKNKRLKTYIECIKINWRYTNTSSIDDISQTYSTLNEIQVDLWIDTKIRLTISVLLPVAQQLMVPDGVPI